MIDIYGIPNCGSVKKALQWARENGVDFVFHNFKTEAPSVELIDKWMDEIGAVTLILDHALYRFEMPDSAREPVYHGLALRVGVRMIVMRMLVLLVLAYVVARLGLMAVDYTVSVIVVKSLVWSVH